MPRNFDTPATRRPRTLPALVSTAAVVSPGCASRLVGRINVAAPTRLAVTASLRVRWTVFMCILPPLEVHFLNDFASSIHSTHLHFRRYLLASALSALLGEAGEDAAAVAAVGFEPGELGVVGQDRIDDAAPASPPFLRRQPAQ